MSPHTVWLVEDDAAIAETLIYSLETDGFAVRWFDRGLPLLAALDTAAPEFVILDVGLPDIGGFELCRRLRQISNVPLLFLTARSDEIDRLLGLEIGADDYVAKPFSPREVSARVRTILRRARPVAPTQTASPPHLFQLDEARASIQYQGQHLSLTRYEYLLLKWLLQHPGHVFSRQQLLDHVWQDGGDSLDRTVDTHIKTLRAKLKAVDAEANPILTHRGLGYSLCA